MLWFKIVNINQYTALQFCFFIYFPDKKYLMNILSRYRSTSLDGIQVKYNTDAEVLKYVFENAEFGTVLNYDDAKFDSYLRYRGSHVNERRRNTSLLHQVIKLKKNDILEKILCSIGDRLRMCYLIDYSNEFHTAVLSDNENAFLKLKIYFPDECDVESIAGETPSSLYKKLGLSWESPPE